jgi:predicted ATPase/DNA-binding CsgD family transcriptional regulator
MMTDSPSAHLFNRQLPGSPTPFIGRKPELDNVLSLIQDPSVRLVTILGTGGVGKTRFALELAGVLQAQFQHGVVFIPLAQLSTIDELLPALAGDLGVQLPPGGDLQQVVLDHLSNKQILLMLDNFEHLLEEAVLIRDILVAGPKVKVLVTSREKLNLESETLYHLRGLEFPAPDNLQPVEKFDAVRLFLQKARQARPGFSLSEQNTPAVVRICQMVDGIPLGLLLAAAWVENFSPSEIADQIGIGLDFLTRELRDAPPRHFGMRAVFDSSLERLDKQQKTVFRKLALFRGGFSLAAAEAVGTADLRTLLTLIDKSLLSRDPDSGRYDMHELLRQYANEELAAEGERETLIEVHANYYNAFVHQRQALLKSSPQAAALDEIQADFDNIRQACGWTIEQRNFSAARSMTPGLYAFCDMRSQFYEGEAIFRLACQGLAPQTGEAPDPAWALALLSWYDLRSYIERFESFEEITCQAQSCLEQAILLHDPEGIAASQVLLGAIAEDQGDFNEAIRCYEAGMKSCPPFDDIYWVNMRIGLCHQAAQEYPEAIQSFQVSLRRGKETGERVKMGWSLLNIGDTLILQGNAVEAERYLEEAHALFQEVGTTMGVLWSKYSLSRIALNIGNPTRSRELAEDALQIARQVHSIKWISKVEELLGQIDPQPKQTVARSGDMDFEPFSQREMEVLQLLKSDMSGPEIARTLVISLNTVRYHTKNIYQKLQVNNRLEAIYRAKELGL